MARRQKISQMNPKGANLQATDLLEVSVLTGTGYDTYSITGQEIINAGGGGGSQNLQQVTDIGSTTTNSITITSGVNEATTVSGIDIRTENTLANTHVTLRDTGEIALRTGAEESSLQNTNVSNPGVILEFPDKTTGSYTIATTSDIPVLSDYMTKAVYDPDNDGIVESSRKEMVGVINKTGATVVKGSIVYLKSSSSSGTYPEILLADADTEATSSKTLGAVYEDIANDATGFVVTSGEVNNLDTTAYSIGDKLWLSQTAGQVTTTPPTQPAHTVFIGTVTRSQNTNGRILYAIQNGYELGELHDVLLTAPANNETLVYESSTSLWKNKPILTGLGWFKTTVTTNYTLTGTTSETIVSSTQLATLSNGTIFKINTLRITKGAVAGSTIRAYLSPNSNNLSGAVQILSTGSTIVTGTRLATISRVFEIEGGNIKGLNAATGVINDNGTSTVVGLDAALPSGTLYLIVTFTNSAVGESTTQELLDISNF